VDDQIKCFFRITGQVNDVQLPVLFYPNLIDLRIDGKPATYFPLAHPPGPYVLTGITLEPGYHEVVARFRGLVWANVVSAVAWIGTLLGLGASLRSMAVPRAN
jgi:hypothetical protein